ncbi:MAG TPA: RNA polymerase sigma factor [Kofleriaceae bacterium]|nr:RNA polymerase sigma factor [Kofleriaceae bacterium]
MGSNQRQELFKRLIGLHWRRLFNFCFRMTLDRDRAKVVVEESFLRAYVATEELPPEPRMESWLLRIANHVLEKRLPRNPEVTFEMLDETLRSEATRTDAVRSLAEPTRDFLLWELKQGCMTSVVNCLSPGERAAFVLAHVMRMQDAEAAATLNITASAYKVRLSRARKKVSDYLAPRCEHIDPLNPCRCPARVGIALSKGFIRPAGEVALRAPVQPFGRYGVGPDAEDAPQRDVVAVYGNLPDPDPPDDLAVHMTALIDDGTWDKVRDRKTTTS